MGHKLYFSPAPSTSSGQYVAPVKLEETALMKDLLYVGHPTKLRLYLLSLATTCEYWSCLHFTYAERDLKRSMVTCSTLQIQQMWESRIKCRLILFLKKKKCIEKLWSRLVNSNLWDMWKIWQVVSLVYWSILLLCNTANNHKMISLLLSQAIRVGRKLVILVHAPVCKSWIDIP